MLEKKDINLEKVVLIGIVTKDQDEVVSKEYLDELEFLTYTAGGEVVKRYTQKLDMPNPKTFIGSGKMNDVQEFVKTHEIGTVIFDDELSPAQERNISKILNCKILDRTNLIRKFKPNREKPSATPMQGRRSMELGSVTSWRVC